MQVISAFTVGFTKKSAEDFFSKIRNAGVKRLLDVRLNNSSQLAGFAKRDDLKYFLKEIGNIEYEHVPALAPTKEILDQYKKHGGAWDVYEREFLDLMARRRIEEQFSRDLFDGSCLLCSEHSPKHCHRRLVFEYLSGYWNGMLVKHII